MIQNLRSIESEDRSELYWGAVSQIESTVNRKQCDQTGLFLAHVAIFDLSVARKFWRAENSPITKLWLFLTFQNFISKITE